MTTNKQVFIKDVQTMTKIADMANKHFYKGELHSYIITMARNSKKASNGVLGYITVQKVWNMNKNKEQDMHEINIMPEYASRPFNEVVATLLHELAHLHNLLQGIQDTSRNGYHNKKFKEVAEGHGLIVESDKKLGHAYTKLNEHGEAFYKKVEEKGLALELQAKMFQKEASKKKSSTRILECPCCGTKARATKQDTILICGGCYQETDEINYMVEVG